MKKQRLGVVDDFLVNIIIGEVPLETVKHVYCELNAHNDSVAGCGYTELIIAKVRKHLRKKLTKSQMKSLDKLPLTDDYRRI